MVWDYLKKSIDHTYGFQFPKSEVFNQKLTLRYLSKTAGPSISILMTYM
jgi:hypothetical protein